MVTLAVDGAPAKLRWVNILSNYLGFGLSSAVPLCFVYVLDKKSLPRHSFKAAVCCEIGYLFFFCAFHTLWCGVFRQRR